MPIKDIIITADRLNAFIKLLKKKNDKQLTIQSHVMTEQSHFEQKQCLYGCKSPVKVLQ